MGVRLLEGPTMVGRTSDWKEELGRFLKPFLDRFGHKARRQMCPLYVSGLIRSWRSQKHSADGRAGRLATTINCTTSFAAGVWDARPVEIEPLVQADRLVGGRDAVQAAKADFEASWRKLLVAACRPSALVGQNEPIA
jgi:hypothetical protein